MAPISLLCCSAILLVAIGGTNAKKKDRFCPTDDKEFKEFCEEGELCIDSEKCNKETGECFMRPKCKKDPCFTKDCGNRVCRVKKDKCDERGICKKYKPKCLKNPCMRRHKCNATEECTVADCLGKPTMEFCVPQTKCVPKRPDELSAKLVNGTSRKNGRVELSLEGNEGSVCNKGLKASAARHVCQQNHYQGAILHEADRFGRSDIWLSKLSCKGSAKTLTECDRVESSVCKKGGSAAITCFNELEHHLVNGTSENNGRVDVTIDGQRGSMCYLSDAGKRVVCRQHGYKGAISYAEDYFGRSSEREFVSHIICPDSAKTLLDCDIEQAPGGRYCQRGSDAISCFNKLDIDLVNGASKNEGRVELNIDGQRGSIRSSVWFNGATGVVCRELGYRSGICHKDDRFGRSCLDILLQEVNCLGREKNLTDCSMRLPKGSTCSNGASGGGAAVTCFNEVELHLVDGTSDNNGRVEVTINGKRGTMCRSYIFTVEPNFICRHLGYKGGEEYTDHNLSRGNVFMDLFYCPNNAKDLYDCWFRTPVGASCRHGVAAVKCHN